MLKEEVYHIISSITNLVLAGFQYIVLCLKFCNLLFSCEHCTSASPLVFWMYFTSGGKGMDSVV